MGFCYVGIVDMLPILIIKIKIIMVERSCSTTLLSPKERHGRILLFCGSMVDPVARVWTVSSTNMVRLPSPSPPTTFVCILDMTERPTLFLTSPPCSFRTTKAKTHECACVRACHPCVFLLIYNNEIGCS